MARTNLDKPIDQSMDEGTSVWMLILKCIGVLVVGIIGAMIGAMGGWFTGAGYIPTKGANPDVTVGAVGGLILFSMLGWCCFFGADCLDAFRHEHSPPEMARTGLGILKSFDLYVTVHEAKNVVNSEGILGYFGKVSDSFVKVEVGRKLSKTSDFRLQKNTPKRTTVQHSKVWEENFKFVVATTDDTMMLTLYDQDMVGDSYVGETEIKITSEILENGFPQKKGYKILREEGFLFGTTWRRVGILVLSFTPGQDFPASVLQQIDERNPLEAERRNAFQKKLFDETQKQYGSLEKGSFLSLLPFDTQTNTHKMRMRAEIEQEGGAA